MNNLELEKCFQEIAAKANIFDKRIALRKFKKEYKKSEFFRATRMSIYKAFAIYEANKVSAALRDVQNIFDIDNAADKINELLASIDLSLAVNRLLSLLDYDKIQEFLDKTNKNDTEELTKLTGELKEIQNHFSSLR